MGGANYFIDCFAFMARGMDTDDSISVILSGLYFSIVSYSAGHLYAFSDWFSYIIGDYAVLSYRDLVDSNGFYTFMAVFNALGTSKVVPHGVYDEYFFIDNVLQTNIYTHFRGLILDFGMIGSLLVSAAAGLFLSIVHIQFLNGNLKAIGASLFAHFIGYCYTSFIISLLIWNSVFASFALVSIILFINSKYKYLLNILFSNPEKGIYRRDQIQNL